MVIATAGECWYRTMDRGELKLLSNTERSSAGRKLLSRRRGGREGGKNNASLLDSTLVSYEPPEGGRNNERSLRVALEFIAKCSSINFVIFAGKDDCHGVFDLLNRGGGGGVRGAVTQDETVEGLTY